jgi:hypothetical protein
MQVLLHKPLSRFVAEHVVVDPPTSPVPTDITRNVDAITRRGQPSQGSLLMAVATG